MIREIRVRNLGIIREADVELSPGFNAVTGETGAGKTLFTTAILAALGEGRASALVGPHGDDGFCEVFVEGVRTVEADGALAEAVLRREFSRAGRARSFLNGRGVPADAVREIAEGTIAVHSQNSHVAFLRPANQLALVDRMDPALDRAAAGYRDAVRRLEAACAAFGERARDLRDIARQRDLLGFQLDEIRAVAPKPGEDQELREARDRVRYRVEMLEALALALGELADGDMAAVGSLGRAQRALSRLAERVDGFAGFAERVESARVEVEDIARELRARLDELAAEPADLDAIESRLGAIESLKKKYGTTIEEVLAYAAEVEARLGEEEGGELELRRLGAEIAREAASLVEEGEALERLRREVGRKLADDVNARLPELMLEYLRFDVRWEPALGEDERAWLASFAGGAVDEASEERIARLASLLPRVRNGFGTPVFVVRNPGYDFEPLTAVVSGGEASRLLLAIETVLANASGVRVYCFDEVDAGVGGEAAVRLGTYLRKLSRHAQVICVTHLAQVAAFADRHLVVERGEVDGAASATVRVVTGEERVEELARMLSGEVARGAAREHARQMLAMARSEALP